jgi:Zn-dependent peptidase ImmA (M78 family)
LTTIAINPDVLRAAATVSGIALSSLREKVSISDQRLADIIAGGSANADELHKLGRALGVSPIILASKVAPDLELKLPDFRTINSSRARVGPETRRVIDKVLDIKDLILEIGESTHQRPLGFKAPTVSLSDDPVAVAQSERSRLGVSIDSQINTDNGLTFLNLVRAKIELANVFVMMKSWPIEDSRGFCIVEDDNIAIIIVNKKEESNGARLFTLAHEYAHILLRVSGISDDSSSNHNETERFCNKFAAEFLMPDDVISFASQNYGLADDGIRLAANRIGISQIAYAYRLKEKRIFNDDVFDSWKNRYSRRNITNNNGPIIPNPIYVKFSENGVRFTQLLKTALESNRLSAAELYSFSGIKVKNFEPIIDVLKERLKRVNNARD